jgi:hypothetical protein
MKVTRTACDVCGRTANGDSPDSISIFDCGHDICDECQRGSVPKGVYEPWCPRCAKQVKRGRPEEEAGSYSTTRDWIERLEAFAKKGTPIEGPPCHECACFTPTVTYETSDKGRRHGGFKLCWVKERYDDFSCFVPRKEES